MTESSTEVRVKILKYNVLTEKPFLIRSQHLLNNIKFSQSYWTTPLSLESLRLYLFDALATRLSQLSLWQLMSVPWWLPGQEWVTVKAWYRRGVSCHSCVGWASSSFLEASARRTCCRLFWLVEALLVRGRRFPCIWLRDHLKRGEIKIYCC